MKSTKSENDNKKITDEQLAEFDHAFYGLNEEKMWTLKSGRVVEKVIYKYARNLEYESYLHSFIINDVDKKVKLLFEKEEWKEIFDTNCKKLPKIDKSVVK